MITLLHVDVLGEQFRILLVSPKKLRCCCDAACPFEMSSLHPLPKRGYQWGTPQTGIITFYFSGLCHYRQQVLCVGQPGGSTSPGAPLFGHYWEWDYELQYRACGGTGELDKTWQMLAGQF